MRVLENIGTPEAVIGAEYNTVRKGTKWTEAQTGEELLISAGPTKDDQTIVGKGRVTRRVVGAFKDVVDSDVIVRNHKPEARGYANLLAAMRNAYGNDFHPSDIVTVLWYERIARDGE